MSNVGVKSEFSNAFIPCINNILKHEILIAARKCFIKSVCSKIIVQLTLCTFAPWEENKEGCNRFSFCFSSCLMIFVLF